MPRGFIRVAKYVGVFYRESASRKHNGKMAKCYYIYFKDDNRDQVWEKVGWDAEGYTAVMASQVRAERLRALRHGEELPTRKKREHTLDEVWAKYDEWLETGKKRPRDDRNLYKKHVAAWFAEKRLSDISPFHLEQMRMDLLKKGYAPATVKHCLVLARQIINKAIAWGMWDGENPTRKIKMPKLNNRRERFLTPTEAERLLGDLEMVSDRLHDMSLLSLHTGMRAGEIFGLRWGDVDLDNKLIHIADPKSGEARKAFMTQAVAEALQARKNGENHLEEYVFTANRGSGKGGKILEVSNAFARAVDRLGFNDGIMDPRQKVTFHTLRHTFASWLALRGTPILTIKELLGHKSLAMTERYSHLLPDHKREAVSQLEQYLQNERALERGKLDAADQYHA